MFIDNCVESLFYVDNDEVSNECIIDYNHYNRNNESGKNSIQDMNRIFSSVEDDETEFIKWN